MHNLLRRQLRRYLGVGEPPDELADLLAAIDGAYSESDSDREMVERSLELASEELMERNASLQRSEEYFRSLIEKSSDVILVLDTQACIAYASPSLTRVMGYAPEDVHGLNGLTFVHADDLAETAESFGRTVLGTNEDVAIEFRGRHADGTWRVLESMSRQIVGVDGQPSVVINFRDVTERKRAEIALQQSEAHWRSLVQNAQDVIAVVGVDDFVVRYCSPAIERMLGFAPQDLVGHSTAQLMHPDDLATVAEWNAQVQNSDGHEGSTEFRMRHADGRWVHVEARAKLVHGEEGDFVVVNGRDVTERKRAEEKIRFMAYHDALTGLPNRDLLRDRLDQAIGQARRNEEHFAVISLDLDRMKAVNDSVGHAQGDDLLREVAQRLSRISRDGDTLARVGGDEFVLLLPQLETVQEAASFANRIMESLRRPIALGGQTLRVTASIGLAVFPDDGRDTDTLIRNADVAMYRAKEQGRDNLQLYAASMNASIVARLSLERELIQAVERGEFVLYYQPIADVSTQRIVGAEALIRWQHPERGLVPPDEFIPIAEETGLILQIGAWVLETACRQGAEWERTCPGFTVAVNVSAKQLLQPNFVALVRDALWNSGISPSALELEVTETAAMANPERIAQALGAVGSMGVRPVIDDFGTGYSSLSHLKQLPVVKLKIDKSFTHDVTSDPNDAAIASATIVMAHSLKLVVTAEGIETKEQLDFYRVHGCDEMQGYLLGRPGPPEEITRLIGTRVPQPAPRAGSVAPR